MTNVQLFTIKFNELIIKAEKIYDINMSDVGLMLDLKGNSTLGVAVLAANGRKFIRFNTEAVEHYLDHMVDDTLPHEVAHMVEYVQRGSSNHGANWKKICAELGGNPTRCFDGLQFPLLKPARKMREWLYINEQGNAMNFSTVRHNRMQNKGITYSGSLGKYSAEDFVGEVK